MRNRKRYFLQHRPFVAHETAAGVIFDYDPALYAALTSINARIEAGAAAAQDAIRADVRAARRSIAQQARRHLEAITQRNRAAWDQYDKQRGGK